MFVCGVCLCVCVKVCVVFSGLFVCASIQNKIVVAFLDPYPLYPQDVTS